MSKRYNLNCNEANEHDKRIIKFLDNETIAPTTFIKQLLLDYLNGKLVYSNSVIIPSQPIEKVEETINVVESIDEDSIEESQFKNLEIDLGF